MRKLLNTLYIISPDTYLRLDGENVVIQRDGNRDIHLPLHTLENIICFTYRGASPQLLGKCVEVGIDVSFFTPEGRFLARVSGLPNGNVLLRREQYRIADSYERKILYARQFILGKVFNSRWILERLCRDHPEIDNISSVEEQSAYLKAVLPSIAEAENINGLMGIEGDCARHYFSVFGSLIRKSDNVFYFAGRNKRPPLDAVNALLSFAYSILAKDCTAALASIGLDPYVGFLHSDRPGRVSLALDLEEELRGPVADRFVISGINLGIFTSKMFDFRENGAVFLNDDGRKLFLQKWQSHKKEQLRHPFLEERIEWGLVPYVQALLLARTIRGDLDSYPPFLWK
ncbi:MAG: type I-C CRISPR-associated endonuclease Cas1 [Spirochaetes bacterium]|uniref:CRISPR-associated endonuclease Cas1 n=1 Tax=Candidatus Ornithospirochaeta stercoripullorum TaxID=2840899 RepID=A0A9D9H6K4_9SPIO|nr:type I-C CRISPR-associated endonuclease Cas1 [Candidatus Ornithospirochaeta stercoripullorum]